MQKPICDYCGKEILDSKNLGIIGDLDSKNSAMIEVKPILLCRADDRIEHPDLCRDCIIKALRG